VIKIGMDFNGPYIDKNFYTTFLEFCELQKNILPGVGKGIRITYCPERLF